MTVGIIPNIGKENILEIVKILIGKLKVNGLNYILSESLIEFKSSFNSELNSSSFMDHISLAAKSDIIVSIGGDGTMLHTAYDARKSNTPMLGVNFGKLGFLAEFDINSIDDFIKNLKKKKYIIEERIALEAVCKKSPETELYSINDLVIDKGRWPKMIELTVTVDDDYVTRFSADGIIIATPTGSTGYSLSTGGPIVSPKADVITMSPIAPHTLTMRPLVLDSRQRIKIRVDSPHTTVQVNCDGQRVNYFEPPVDLEVYKSKDPIRLVHASSTNYFDILRKKLLWGLDLRSNANNKEDKK
jgi:NAD+ kinase